MTRPGFFDARILGEREANRNRSYKICMKQKRKAKHQNPKSLVAAVLSCGRREISALLCNGNGSAETRRNRIECL